MIKQVLVVFHSYGNRYALDNYEIHLNVKNNTNETVYVTTKDFKIKNKTLDKFLSEAEQRKYFLQMKSQEIIFYCKITTRF